MPVGQTSIQIGKNGLTKNLIGTLKNHFIKRKNVKVNVLKSAGHDREQVKKMSEEILSQLGSNYTARIVGFTIFLKKWRTSIDKRGQKR